PDLPYRPAAHRAHGTARARRRSRARLMAGILYAIPTPLGGKAADALPASALKTVMSLRHFVVENAKSARAFLKDVGMPCEIQEVEISVLDTDVSQYIKKLQQKQS